MKFFHPPHLYCVTTLPCKTNATANIGVRPKCFVLLTTLNLSIVLKWCAAAQAKLQCSMCPQPFLITASRRLRYSLILLTVINETLWEFLPLGYYRSLQYFHRLEPSLVVDSLLKSTRNSVIHGINIRAIRRPHVRFNEVDVLFFQIDHHGPGGVRWRSILLQCPPVMTTYCSDVRQQTLFEDDIATIWAVNSRIDEDYLCLPHTRYSNRQHDVATEV